MISPLGNAPALSYYENVTTRTRQLRSITYATGSRMTLSYDADDRLEASPGRCVFWGDSRMLDEEIRVLVTSSPQESAQNGQTSFPQAEAPIWELFLPQQHLCGKH